MRSRERPIHKGSIIVTKMPGHNLWIQFVDRPSPKELRSVQHVFLSKSDTKELIQLLDRGLDWIERGEKEGKP